MKIVSTLFALFSTIILAAKEITLALVCSSACQTYNLADPAHIHGWGEVLPEFLDENIKILNFAKSGRSTKSFILHGNWAKVVAAKPDYVILALGANDTPATKKYATTIEEYKKNLHKMAKESAAAGSKVLFCTLNQSMRTRDNGTRVTFFNGEPLRKDRIAHSQAVREVAAELNLPCLELFDNQYRYMKQLGEKECAKFYRIHHQKKHFGKIDGSHTNLAGARFVAMIIAEELAKSATPLADHVNKEKVEIVKKQYSLK